MFDEAEYLALYPDVAAAVEAGAFKTGFEHFQKHGEKEGRSPCGPHTPREKAVFHLIDKKGLGLEIGPSHNPIAPKSKGYNVQILDHLSADELRAKYQGHGVNLNSIEEVDFIWRGQSLTDLIGKTECYDWIIASHVVEHVPDFISFFIQCESLLKPHGVLSLVIPDKRYCFDFFQQISSTGQMLDAYHERRVRPSSGQIFDYFSNSATSDGAIAWSGKHVSGVKELIHSLSEAKVQYKRVLEKPDYIDVHCWRFTPASFGLIVSDLNALGLIELEISASFPTSGCEFYVSLSKFSGNKFVNQLKRSEILLNVLDESRSG